MSQPRVFTRRQFGPAIPLMAAWATLASCAGPPPERVFVVFFGPYSAVPDDDARQILVRAAAAAKAYPSDPVQVVGFADPEGAPEENRRLSQSRSEAVSAYLAQLGVAPARLMRSARGATQPMLTMVESRRVEIRIGALAT